MNYINMIKSAINYTTKFTNTTKENVMSHLSIIEIKELENKDNNSTIDIRAMRAWITIKKKIFQNKGYMCGCKQLLVAINESLREEGVTL